MDSTLDGGMTWQKLELAHYYSLNTFVSSVAELAVNLRYFDNFKEIVTS